MIFRPTKTKFCEGTCRVPHLLRFHLQVPSSVAVECRCPAPISKCALTHCTTQAGNAWQLGWLCTQVEKPCQKDVDSKPPRWICFLSQYLAVSALAFLEGHSNKEQALGSCQLVRRPAPNAPQKRAKAIVLTNAPLMPPNGCSVGFGSFINVVKTTKTIT